ncbi:MAG: SDR family oxidoreductase [Pirellulaceae bacterium]|nr:SDR family oxidoreductase [Pirellulaceae bacterium]
MTTPVALVTGSGARRVGRKVAEALAGRGYALALHYHTSRDEAQQGAAELRTTGIEAEAFGADLTDESATRDLIATVLARFGRLDALVHCAAIWKPIPLEKITAADVRKYFDANTLATLLIAREAGLAMTKQPSGGSIVLVGDWATVRPYLNYAAYFASKGAIPTLTRTLAVELATRNPAVRVNCIQPGPVMLPPDLPAAEREQAIRGTLVKREGSPRNIALAALHFLDNDFVTGACLPVDGGRSIHSADT